MQTAMRLELFKAVSKIVSCQKIRIYDVTLHKRHDANTSFQKIRIYDMTFDRRRKCVAFRVRQQCVV